LLYKVYNFVVVEAKVYLNNGVNFIEAENDRQVTNSNDRTLQLELQYPFLVQRNPINVQVYNYGNFNQLFSIPRKAIWCSLFSNGYIMLV
jgi:hypothetical protein